MAANQPNLFIFGGAKCGTTSLAYYLSQHKEIYFSQKKEPFYFAKDFDPPTRPSFDEYLSLFDAENKKYYAEGTPWYLYSQIAAEEIHKFNPKSKIIIIIRNPFEVLTSLFDDFSYKHSENKKSLYDALIAIEHRKNGDMIPDLAKPFYQKLFYLDVIKYSEQIKRVYKYFNKDNVYIINFDDLKNKTSDSLISLFNFLDIDNDISGIDLSVKNKAKKNKSNFIKRVITEPSNGLRKIVNACLPTKIKHTLRSKFIKLNSIKGKKTEIDNKSYQLIYKQLNKEIDEIQKLVGFDVKHWADYSSSLISE